MAGDFSPSQLIQSHRKHPHAQMLPASAGCHTSTAPINPPGCAAAKVPPEECQHHWVRPVEDDGRAAEGAGEAVSEGRPEDHRGLSGQALLLLRWAAQGCRPQLLLHVGVCALKILRLCDDA